MPSTYDSCLYRIFKIVSEQSDYSPESWHSNLNFILFHYKKIKPNCTYAQRRYYMDKALWAFYGMITKL